jgi:N4-gp56 family major capsid protein
MANTTTTTLNDLFTNVIAQARFTAEEQSLMLGLVTQYNIGNQAGTTIQVPKYPAIDAADLTEGTDMTGTAVSTGSVSVSVGEVGAQVVLTDLAAMGAGNPADELGTVLGNAIATKIDKDLIGLFDSFTTSVGGATTEFTAAHIFEAVAKLRNAGAVGQLACVVNPLAAYNMKANLTSTFADPNGGDIQNEAMRTGYVGTIAGVNVYESRNVAVASDASKGAVFAPEAIAIALKRDFDLEVQRDASLRANELNATAVYGKAVLDNAYGVELHLESSI